MPNESEPSSPVANRDKVDPGDATGQNFRYQYAYGVILLVGALRRLLDYQAIWCEQREDFLGEINDNLFDAYQVKTQQPEYGWWQHNSEPYSKSVCRFVQHEKHFPGKIRRYYFVSNAKPLDTDEERYIYQSPCQLRGAVIAANDSRELAGECKRGFEYLLDQAGLTADDRDALFGVLRRLSFPDNTPDRNTFITALAHEYVSHLEDCEHLSAQQLNRVAEHLINLVASASCLGSQDPSRHYVALGNGQTDPQLLHKRIDIERFRSTCREVTHPSVTFPAELSTEPLTADVSRLERFRKKLQHGGFVEDEMEAFRRQTLLAHGKLLELATRGADGETLVREIENIVLDECNAAKIAASSAGGAVGKEMFLKLRQQLQAVAQQQGPRVKRLPYEVLMGMAGLLTEDCTVWWSEKFDLTKDI